MSLCRFLSKEEPKMVSKALKHPGWVDVMQEELNKFTRNKVWTLVPTPYGKIIICSKWVFRNKRDETRIVIKNKARLVAQGYNQQEGIDYDETFSPVARLEQSIAISSAESEYVADVGCCANILWMKSQLTNHEIIYEKVPIFYDNTSVIEISNNPVLHSRTKHIDIKYHFTRDHILKGDIELHFIPTHYQLADIFTKPLDEPTFKRLIVELGYNREIEVKGTLKKNCLPPRWRVQVDYAQLICEDLIHKLKKKTREKIVPYPRFLSFLLEHMMPEYDYSELNVNPTQVFSVHNWTLKPNQPEKPPFTNHMLAIRKLDVPVISKALKPTSQTKEVPQGKKPGAKRQNPKPSITSTPVVGEMHKEANQAAGGPTSLADTSEEGAHPQLSSGHDASAYSITKVDPRSSTPNDSISS
nr:retrovirus-related Pol polyprotein from transposon TNT 1-94 [Tanacetum cinerariifolium]